MSEQAAPIHGDWGCENCTFLGSIDNHDYYFCPQHGIPTVIARYGPDHEYESGMCFAYGESTHLTAAREMAKHKGLI
jgi:hypothetical protein